MLVGFFVLLYNYFNMFKFDILQFYCLLEGGGGGATICV